MSKLWLFGDSFTADNDRGTVWVSEEGKKYLWDDQRYKRKSWGKELAELTNYELDNYARAGCSNFVILDTLLRNLIHIQPNDIVFIGLTRNVRYTYCHPDAVDRLEPINWGIRYELQRTVDIGDQYTTYSPAFKNMSSDKINEIINFFTNHNVEEDSHIVTHNKIIADRIVDIQNIIHNNFQAKCYIWDSNLWEYPNPQENPFNEDVNWGPETIFETIYTWTNKLAKDGHWSPNGDLLAAHFFDYCIKNDIRSIQQKDLAHWYLTQGKQLRQSLEYIEFDPNL